MKPFAYLLLLAGTTIAVAGCSPKTQAECLMDVSKHAQSDKAALIGMQACKDQFPDQVKLQQSEQGNQSAVNFVEPGDVVDGYVFLGGDPSQKENWILNSFNSTDKLEMAKIEEAHPTWLATVNSLDFATWMISQPSEIKALADSDKADDAIKMLDLFEDAQLEIANND